MNKIAEKQEELLKELDEVVLSTDKSVSRDDVSAFVVHALQEMADTARVETLFEAEEIARKSIDKGDVLLNIFTRADSLLKAQNDEECLCSCHTDEYAFETCKHCEDRGKE